MCPALAFSKNGNNDSSDTTEPSTHASIWSAVLFQQRYLCSSKVNKTKRNQLIPRYLVQIFVLCATALLLVRIPKHQVFRQLERNVFAVQLSCRAVQRI
ncbi:uncharacterized protein UBRO_20972 [Ustilago bromivora]|uniref:Uncharacterized protein n=1 Tax=Ustilago bromivora TaxID=307758 RepID=A0A1K0GE51_9BASI|nr:uncharacterized protein UBRO_20972 [Ustilago bromivora]